MAIPSTTDRQICIFISSTFEGMQQERNELVSKTFPVLREIGNTDPFFIGIVGDRYGWRPSLNGVRDNIFRLSNQLTTEENSL